MKTFALSLAVGLAAGPAFGQLTIERVAPENSVVVVGMPNAQLSRERFERTALFDLWNSEEFKKMREDDPTDLTDPFQEFLDELEIDREDLSLPTGPAGFALFPVVDDETGRPVPGMIAFADFGATSGAMGALVQAALDRGERDGMLEYEIKDVLGRSVYEIRPLDGADPMGGEDDVDPFGAMPGPQDMLGDLAKVYYLQDENVFMLGSDLGSLTESLDRIDGNVRNSLADRDDLQAILGQVGRDDFYFALLTRDLMQIASSVDEMGMLQFFGPTIKELFGDIRGIGMGARIDGNDAMVEGRWSMYMPNGKQGLTRLVDLTAPRQGIPAFVGPDAISYGSMNFQFDQVVSVVRSVINSNPMLAMQAEEIMPIIEGPVADILATLGTRIHSAATVTRPITADSMTGFLAIEARDQQQFENVFGQFAPQMGLEPRDFLGQRIYSMDMGMMGPGADSFALGIGGSHVFIGATPSVEQALRTVSQPDQALTLSDDPTFQEAVGLLSQRQVVGWNYLNLVEMLAVTEEVTKLQFEQMMQEFEAEGFGDEMGDMPEMDQEIDWDVIRRYIGPVISEMRSTDEGFVGTLFLIEPAN